MMVGSTWKAKKTPRLSGPELTASRPKTNLEPSVVKPSRLTTAPPSQEMAALGQPRGANQERSFSL